MKSMRRGVLKAFVVLVAAGFSIALVISVSSAESIIIDHSCIDLSQVPEHWVTEAKARFRMSYGHTSHGSQIVTGMNLLRGDAGSLYWFDHDGTSGGLSLHDVEPAGDLGNPDRITWASRTRALLDAPDNDRNMIMWSWCGQADTSEEEMNVYLDLMNQLEVDYPDVTFIYMTGHLNGTGEAGNLNVRNNQIRNYCAANDKILFDFADIESYDPDGNYFLDQGADDGCNYDGGNWADEWCAANPGECESCSCAHSQCLNCQVKGRAFWWMMARIAGWETDLTYPIVEKVRRRKCENGKVIRILGTNFGHTQGGSIVHIGPRTFDATSPRIKLWSDTKIRFRIPKKGCVWFKGQDYRKRKVWVTVDGVDSNVARFRVMKPETCP